MPGTLLLLWALAQRHEVASSSVFFWSLPHKIPHARCINIAFLWSSGHTHSVHFCEYDLRPSGQPGLNFTYHNLLTFWCPWGRVTIFFEVQTLEVSWCTSLQVVFFVVWGKKKPTNFKDYLSTPKHERLGCLTQSSGSTALTKRVLIWRLLKAVGLVVWSGWCWLCWLFVWLFGGAYVRVTGSSVEIRSWGITPVLFLWLNHVFQQFPYCIGINASLLCISMCSDTP